MQKFLLSTFLVCMLLACGASAAPILTLNPVSGALSGAPGSTIGWGFTITSDLPDYMAITYVEFTPPPAFGTFTDFAGYNFLVIGPSGTVTQAFNAGAMSGLGSFQILGSATPGVYNGELWVHWESYADDPSGGPSGDPTGSGVFQPAVSITVTAPTAVPEPGSWLMFAGGLGAVCFLRRKKQ